MNTIYVYVEQSIDKIYMYGTHDSGDSLFKGLSWIFVFYILDYQIQN